MGNAIELGSRRVLHPGKLRWLRATGWLLALFVATAAAFVLTDWVAIWLVATAAGEPFPEIGKARDSLQLAGVGAGVAAVVGIYWAAVRWGENRPVVEYSLRGMVPELALGFAAGAVLMLATILVLWAAGWSEISAQPVTEISDALKNTLQSGFVEETLFRLSCSGWCGAASASGRRWRCRLPFSG